VRNSYGRVSRVNVHGERVPGRHYLVFAESDLVGSDVVWGSGLIKISPKTRVFTGAFYTQPPRPAGPDYHPGRPPSTGTDIPAISERTNDVRSGSAGGVVLVRG